MMRLIKMERYMKEQRILIVKTFYKNSAATVRKMRSIWGIYNGPNEATVRRFIKKFRESESVVNVKRFTRVRPGCSNKNIEAMQSFEITAIKGWHTVNLNCCNFNFYFICYF